MVLDPKTTVLLIDIIGVAAGVISIAVIILAQRRTGGQVGSIFWLILTGIFFQMTAIIYTIIFSRLKILPAPDVDIHHLIMTIGLVFFAIAAKKFFEISS